MATDLLKLSLPQDVAELYAAQPGPWTYAVWQTEMGRDWMLMVYDANRHRVFCAEFGENQAKAHMIGRWACHARSLEPADAPEREAGIVARYEAALKGVAAAHGATREHFQKELAAMSSGLEWRDRQIEELKKKAEGTECTTSDTHSRPKKSTKTSNGSTARRT